MVNVCTSEQFTETGGILGLAAAAFADEVATVYTASVGDGTFTAAGASGKLLIDQELHWASTFPCEVNVLPVIRRKRRSLRTTSSNVAMVRERYTTLVGVDSGTLVQAPEPVNSSTYDSEWGGGAIVGTGATGTNTPRSWDHFSCPEATTVLDPITVPVGSSLSMRFRASLFTPNGFQAASVGTDINDVYVYGNRLSFLVLPTPI
ncbi:DUF7172 family protein [Rhodococcus aetherivorans]